jgi:hypothetical protein
MGNSKARTAPTADDATGTDVATTAAAGGVVPYDYGNDAGKGFENQDAADYGVPFVALLQSKSKAVEKEGSTMRGGMLMLTDTQETFDGKTGFLFVPSTTQHVFNLWVPRAKGGGLVGRLAPGDAAIEAAMEKAGKRVGKGIVDKEGNEVVETFYIYGQLVSEDGDCLGMAVIGCNSTKIKPYQGLMGRLRKHLVNTPKGKFNPPLFANLIRVTTELEQYTEGSSYNFRFTPAVEGDLVKSLLRTDDPRYIAARSVRDMVDSGQIKASAKGEAAARGSAESEPGDASSDKDF